MYQYEKDQDGIVLLTMDQEGPVNKMNVAYQKETQKIIDQLKAEQGLKGVVLASAKSTFFAGADLEEMLGYASPEDIFNLVDGMKQNLRA